MRLNLGYSNRRPFLAITQSTRNLRPCISYYLIAMLFDFLPHLYRNRFTVTWPRVTGFLKELHANNADAYPVGVAGFCWGGLHAIRLTHETGETITASGLPLADAIFAAHPSSVDVAADIGNVRRNLSIAIGDDDAVMGIKQVRQAELILASKSDIDSEVIIYPGAKHGFSIRASRVKADSVETRQAAEAEEQAVSWFKRRFDAVSRTRQVVGQSK